MLPCRKSCQNNHIYEISAHDVIIRNLCFLWALFFRGVHNELWEDILSTCCSHRPESGAACWWSWSSRSHTAHAGLQNQPANSPAAGSCGSLERPIPAGLSDREITESECDRERENRERRTMEHKMPGLPGGAAAVYKSTKRNPKKHSVRVTSDAHLPLSPRPQEKTSRSLVTARTWDAPQDTWRSS